jgi:hypothetical protein
MVGIILVLYITAWIGGTRKWTRALNIVCFPVVFNVSDPADLADQLQLLHHLHTPHLGSLRYGPSNTSDPEREPQDIQFHHTTR